MLSLTTIAIIVLVIGLIYQFFISPYIISPLSKIPNAHFTSPITSLWILHKRKTGNEVKTIYSLHQQHGPVVRLGPNELSVNSIDGLRTIYTGGFEKTQWYSDIFVNFGTDNLVSTQSYKPHSIRKRMLSNVYSKSYLQNSPDLQRVSLIIVVDRFLPLLGELAQKREAINVFPLLQGLGQDFTSAYLFGSKYGTDFIHDVAKRECWLDMYEKFKVSHPKERSFGEFEQWCLALCDKVTNDLKEGKASSDQGTQPVVYAQFYRSLQKNPEIWERKRLMLASEMLDHLIAGHETSGISLTYTLWELSQRPALQARLRVELLGLSPTLRYASREKAKDGSLPSTQSLNNLPLLDSIIRETLRLHTAVPGPQPRVVPFSSQPVTIEGYPNIPGGTIVSSSAFSLHRIADVYPNPDEWLPERWLNPDSSTSEAMKRLFWAFGSGGRMCLGSNFALQVIKLVIATIYTNFTTSIVNDEGIEQEDNYIAPPKGRKLILQFIAV
ncbi:cytochrome P450 monooxygenase, putative [Talaromyces stipitatus ATCC 10500]|uniref:Cytochrome P450 monooxygenase, putative n=1 Tax=Talaromyces stipitatus (strain ATCC 10500 / CBS 375.48 / QM 6759 / NRRL 1006) TaxID=441959 RepID=B8LW97_TALSN|nr:cytochrome P450 monooxygenase, putative [Talaromyces stipitatus ATCC 10500]EED24125.1 cytochrome P450 monooxygenase, putative [Talaromyces stipitatus ATCC 10500]